MEAVKHNHDSNEVATLKEGGKGRQHAQLLEHFSLTNDANATDVLARKLMNS